MYSTVPAGSLVTLGGHLRVVLHSDDATASVSADPRRHWRTEKSPRRFHRKRTFAIGQLSKILRNLYNIEIRGLNKVIKYCRSSRFIVFVIFDKFYIFWHKGFTIFFNVCWFLRYENWRTTGMRKKKLLLRISWLVQDNTVCNEMRFSRIYPSADSTHSCATA